MAEGFGRRAFLTGAGAAAGLLLSRGLGVRGAGAPTRGALSFDEALRALTASLTAGQRERIVLPWDHPSRQITNTLAVVERPHLGTLLSPAQQALARRLCEAMLSERGARDLAGTFAVEGRFEGCTLLVYGEPERGAAQASLSGGHVHVRGSSRGLPDEPLGGAVAYGHQIGNHVWRIEGNSFAYHGDAANRFYAALDPLARSRAVGPTPPHELVLQPRATEDAIPGVRVGGLGEAPRSAATQLLDTLLGLYPEDRHRAARDAIDGNGGVDALRVAFYESRGFYADMRSFGELDAQERARRGDPYWQVWRIEGPGTVIHFKGYPHCHAYVNVVRDPTRANVGESLGATAGVEGEAMRRLIEAALRRASGEALAWQPEDVPGRFCPGEVTTGLAWSLDPYQNRVVVATIAGRAMADALRERLASVGVAIDPETRYRVATLDYSAGLEDSFGDPDAVETSDVLLRDALVDHLRGGGLREPAAT